MPARWPLLPTLLALSLAGPLGAAPRGPQAAISRCASTAGTTLAGIGALSKACPGVEAALDQLGLTALLPPGWRKTLTAHELADLAALTRRYGRLQPPGPAEAAALKAAAARLVPPQPPPTWSGRLMAWIQHRAGPLLHEIGRWLRSLGPQAGHTWRARALLYGLTALLLAAAAALLTFELRGAGLIRRRRRPVRARRGRTGAGLTEPAAARSGEPEWAHLRASPAQVLRLLIDALTRSHRLERDRHLTCRELQARAQLDTAVERDEFARVARLAEREVYGPPGTTLLEEETLRSVRTLHARLLAAAEKGAGTRP